LLTASENTTRTVVESKNLDATTCGEIGTKKRIVNFKKKFYIHLLPIQQANDNMSRQFDPRN